MISERKIIFGPKTKLVYICHPLSGDIKNNITAVRVICDAIVKQELPKRLLTPSSRNSVVPIAPHLLFPAFMDDDAQEQRDLALQWCLELVARVDEVWVFGWEVSAGMRLEIEKASALGIPVLFKDAKTFGG